MKSLFLSLLMLLVALSTSASADDQSPTVKDPSLGASPSGPVTLVQLPIAADASFSTDYDEQPNPASDAPEGRIEETASVALSPQAPLTGPEELATTDQQTSSGANDFAFRLTQALAAESGNQNLVASPFSVWLPLAALTGEAQEPARTEMIALLAKNGLQPGDLDQSASKIILNLTTLRRPNTDQDPLKIANAVFVNSDLKLKADFAKKFFDFYHGEAKNIDFRSSNAADLVNDWIAEQTEQKITSVVSKFDPNTVIALVNAIYLSNSWAKPFNPELTKKGVFKSPNGEVEAFLMEQQLEARYYEDEQIQALPLILSGGEGLLVLLPKDGDVNCLLASLSDKKLSEIDQLSTLRKGRLVLPRFKIESPTLDLEPSLTKLGVTLFDPQLAALTGGLVEGDHPLFLSQALHKALIEVDENGLTAAAATVMGIAVRSMLSDQQPFEMLCDQPFVFVVYQKTSDNPRLVLFSGIVNQP
ncbi:MAG: serpin family protein [Deltaproteobacteria bacterium]|jgi:serpin B|nr:serpin family protein [Deltaproteobacteria bacterium]